MRLTACVLATVLLFASAPVLAQGWAEYRNTEEGFLVNMPGEPRAETIRYTTESGASVPARLFFAAEGTNRYTMTVVDLSSSAADDDGTRAMAHEAAVSRPRGRIRFDESSELDGIHGHQLSMIEPDGRRVLIQLY